MFYLSALLNEGDSISKDTGMRIETFGLPGLRVDRWIG